MEETNETKNFMTTAEDFVEGGLQDACDDACSICLEPFRESDPSSVTNCKHEFHLQCILEWCQRSSQCPMCWQFVSLKDPESQELLDAVKLETKRVVTQRRNHHNFGETELQQLMIDADDNEIEEYILRHLAAATAMGRNQRHVRRAYDQVQSSSHGRPRFLVLSTHSNTPPSGASSPPPNQIRGDDGHVLRNAISPSPPHVYDGGGGGSASQVSPHSNVRTGHRSTSPSAARSMLIDNGTSNILSQSSSHNQYEAGPSEFQSFTESLKSRFNAVSMRYKESISKSTRGWKEKLFSRSASSVDVDSEDRRGMNSGITSSSRMVEQEEARDPHSPVHSSFSIHQENYMTADHSIQNSTHGNSPSNDSITTPARSTDSVSL